MSATKKIQWLSRDPSINMADWEKRAIEEAAQAKDQLSRGEIDVVYEIYNRHK